MINTGYILFLVFIETEGVKHLRIQTELDLAEQLQTTLVPPVSLRTAYVEVESRSIPSSKMGGDLADTLVSDGSVTCYVADVSGHGIAAGVLMGMVKTAVRMALLRGDQLDGILRSLQGVLPGLKGAKHVCHVCAGLRFDGIRLRPSIRPLLTCRFCITGTAPIRPSACLSNSSLSVLFPARNTALPARRAIERMYSSC